MHKFNNKVSIIMPCYNASAYIGESIKSVLAQDYEDFELLIVDNASTDNSVLIIEQYSITDRRVKLLRCYSPGAAYARNVGLDNANGRYIAFLDADDLWKSSKLSEQIEFMKRIKCRLSCSSYNKIDEFGYNIGRLRIPPIAITKKQLLLSCDIGCLTVLIDTSNEPIPRFPIIKKEDYAYWFSLINFYNEPFMGCQSVLASYRVHGNGISRSKFKEFFRQWNVYRKHLGLNLIDSVYYSICYAIAGIIKTYDK